MTIRIPAEWEPHACCWMAWAVHREWGKAVQKIKRELSDVVQTIAQYEPVRLLTPRRAAREAGREFACCPNLTIIETPVDDIWMRDIAPTFAVRENGREIVAIDWNFNGWGATEGRPPRPGDRLAKSSASIFAVPQNFRRGSLPRAAHLPSTVGARSSQHEAACSTPTAIRCAEASAASI